MFDSSIDFLLVALGMSAVFLTLGFLTLFLGPRPAKAATVSEAVCIYRNGILIEANPEGMRQLAVHGGGSDTNWRALRSMLSDRFPDFPQNQGTSQAQDITILAPTDSRDTSFVTIDQTNDTARVTFSLQHPEKTDTRRIETDISLRAPYPIWTCDAQGSISWCNDAYRDLAARMGYGNQTLPQLFETARNQDGATPFRTGIAMPDGLTLWFDVARISIGSKTVFFASDANTVVYAEMAQRNIVQTLSKTFSQLPTGLAVFDRGRKLILFNPPLATFTGLTPPFLSATPHITDFFDQLREKRIAPQPKSSKPWQKHVADIIHATEAGQFNESWELPDGKTYRVCGRPLQDGAIALMIDDITAEMTLTRRFRSEIEVAHAAIDALDDPVALFSRSGDHLLCNTSYRNFWKVDPDSTFADYTIHDATTLWAGEICDSPAWRAFEEAALTDSPRQLWTGTLPLRRFGVMQATLTPISGGATLVTFRRAAEVKITQPA
ncbi:PAS domain-containing protein [Shimia isoporae]|uniref:PAS domain-containing protein n=1 Tax=Shimia isoporae TaxID=647720 RepID=A0A4R1N2V2_9RHOB|nr:PAS-domain containing protein [Shimia isoporae]TCK99791.1 PAS domain-containing protein [Shimia isoporae]